MNLGRVFVDTGAWFAIQATDDAHHELARRTLSVIVEASQSLVTSNTATPTIPSVLWMPQASLSCGSNASATPSPSTHTSLWQAS